MTPLLAGMVIDATGYTFIKYGYRYRIWLDELESLCHKSLISEQFLEAAYNSAFRNLCISRFLEIPSQWNQWVTTNVVIKKWVMQSILYINILRNHFFSYSKCRAGAHEFWWTTCHCPFNNLSYFSFCAGVGGAFFYYKENVEAGIHIPDFLAHRKGTLTIFPVLNLGGIIPAPFFYAVWVWLLCYPYRCYKKMLTIIGLVNCFMMLSIPSHGGSYLVNMAAGVAVAWVSVILYQKLTWRESSVFAEKNGSFNRCS